MESRGHRTKSMFPYSIILSLHSIHLNRHIQLLMLDLYNFQDQVRICEKIYWTQPNDNIRHQNLIWAWLLFVLILVYTYVWQTFVSVESKHNKTLGFGSEDVLQAP